jgi:hypothetical protein
MKMRDLIASFLVGAAGGTLAFVLLSRRKPDWAPLRPLITALLNEHEYRHLRRLAGGERFPFNRDATTVFFEAELRRIRALGFIDSPAGRSIDTLLAQGGDVRDHLHATARGREYLALRAEVEHGPRISA